VQYIQGSTSKVEHTRVTQIEQSGSLVYV